MSSASLTSTEAVRHGNYRGPNRDGAATANATMPLCEGRKTADSQLKMVIQQFSTAIAEEGKRHEDFSFNQEAPNAQFCSVRNMAGARVCNTVAHEAKKYEGKKEK